MFLPWLRCLAKITNVCYILRVPATLAHPVTLARTSHQKQVWVKALLESGLTYRRIEKETGISQTTIAAIKRLTPSNLTDLEQCKKQVVGSFYGLARGCQENITLDKLEQSSAYQLIGMASLAVQAARDMEGLNRPQFNVIEVALNVQRLVEQSKARLSSITSTLEATEQRSELT